ncbi:MAG: tRNA (adenosine(37)-N6)-threonylcarbamoyltransferase complex ATPase subunit type 1 TsaE [Holophagaceae bacterium]|jgi:tRNA threonylcarbamoyladenosine biosynthesis protein TsaE
MATHPLPTPQSTIQFGIHCASQSKEYSHKTWLLNGPLGSGKTTWVRGFLQGLGGDPDDVASPTYAILHRYNLPNSSSLYHLDLYRLTPEEVIDLGLHELLSPNDYLVVEWAKIAQPLWPTETKSLTFDYHDDQRLVTYD